MCTTLLFECPLGLNIEIIWLSCLLSSWWLSLMSSLMLFLVQDELGFASHNTFFFLSFFFFSFFSFFFTSLMDIMRLICSNELVLWMSWKMVTDGVLECDVLLVHHYISFLGHVWLGFRLIFSIFRKGRLFSMFLFIVLVKLIMLKLLTRDLILLWYYGK